MEKKCTLSNEELIASCENWVFKLAESGGKDWMLSVPVNFNKDPDVLFIELAERLKAATPQGIGWVKGDIKPEHNVGVLVFIPGEDNHITSGMWDISNEWVLLDEYRTPEEEVTHWMPLPAFPEGYAGNEIPAEWVSVLKEIAKEEKAKKSETGQSQQPGREVEIEAFIEWATKIAFFDEEYRLWNFWEEGKMIDGQFRFTTKEFMEVFKKEVKP